MQGVYMTKSFLREMEDYPIIMNIKDIINFLRISKRGAYRVLNKLKECGKAFYIEGEGWNISKQDFIAWIDEINY